MSDSHTLSQIAAVLLALDNIEGERRQPQAGDLEGDYDAWFDGGAVRVVTGCTTYCFADGTSASVGSSATLNVQVDLASKESFWLGPADPALLHGPVPGEWAPRLAPPAVADVRRGLRFLLDALEEEGMAVGHRGWIVMKHAEIIGRELRERGE